MHVFFINDGQMEKKVFLATWRDIPSQNEVQYTLEGIECNADGVSSKMLQNNVFTVAKRNLEGQDMVYQSIKFCNNVWALAELKISPGSPNITVSLLEINLVSVSSCKHNFAKLCIPRSSMMIT